MRSLAAGLLADVRGGASLSEAMQRRARAFAADYVAIVRAGEVGGKVGQVLGELAELLERRQEIRARLHSALIYPLLLVGLSLVTLGIVVTVLVPSLATAFAESGRPLPAVVWFLMALQARWGEVLAGVGTGLAVGVYAFIAASRRPGPALVLDRLKLKAPLFGRIAAGRETARLARTLGTLLRAGVPLLQALGAACETIANRHMAAGLERALRLVREGARLHHALERETVLPAKAVRMITIGEEAGRLDRMLLKTAAMFELETERDIDRLMGLLTPLLTLVMAVLVGGLMATVMTAILSINELAAP
jgi:general secretion pathway protein F